MPEPFERWLAELAQIKRYSPHTIQAYRRDLSPLQELCAERGCEPQSLDTRALQSALARAHAAGASPRSLARCLSCWRQFYAWLCREHALALNPAADLRSPKRPQPLPKALGIDETLSLFASAPSSADPLPSGAATAPTTPVARPSSSADPNAAGFSDPNAVGSEPSPSELNHSEQNHPEQTANAPSGPERAVQARDLAMLELFYSAGLRLGELVGLDIRPGPIPECRGWVLPDNAEVLVLGKGNKLRTLPLGGPALQALQAWLAVRSVLASDSELALFVGRRGKRIAPRVVQEQLARWGQRTGLPTRLHPHMLRHSFASHLLQSSQDLRAVQELLGHANLSTTQVYTRLDYQHLAKTYDQAHPRAKRKSPLGTPKT